ncbi:hypothetical protein GCM10010922_03420 [Microbacterium sorbitolivorans]|uniref:NUDIX domain-containing protein n=1 Tax=Microbacterium sorbitolivorans TaxID=1867410 RepID=A0A367Y7A7_9MICO|nr:GrpB family protein [Microbacterium sorbitolivorans]RCK61500.1 NUDIX domain-containing protein [Microbacterium sorbitolivorans]GGF31651.1 hypothetical protein GCM10010922_03420 [Microbacterium sorbitolivorans]
MSEAHVEWFGQPIGEPVEIQDPREDWATTGRRWEERLVEALSPLPVQADHIGSTSVPGLAAKPVIDMQIQVPDLLDEDAYVPALERMGMILRARGSDFRFLRPPAGNERNVHIHVCEAGSVWAGEHLAFRDALRGDAALAGEYERLKHRLAAAADSRTAYNRGKESFIREVVARHATQSIVDHRGNRLVALTEASEPELDAAAAATPCPLALIVLIDDATNGVLFGLNTWRHEYELPGGMVEPGESLIEAARRELEEETGIRVDVLTLVGYAEFALTNPLRDELGAVYRATVSGEQASASDEMQQFLWRTPLSTTGHAISALDDAIAEWATGTS